MIDSSDGTGHRTRRRPAKESDDVEEKKAAPPAKKGKKEPSAAKVVKRASQPAKRGRGRPPGAKNKRKGGLDSSSVIITAAKNPRGSSTASDVNGNLTAWEIKSQSAKLGWEKRRANAADKTGSKGASKRGSKRNSATTDDSDVNSGVEDADTTSRKLVDLYPKHRKEMERHLQRIEKVDRFGFFLDDTPPEYDENYDDNEEGEAADKSDAFEDMGSIQSIHRKKVVQFPDQPPFNFLIIRKRLAAGRYDIDMVALEIKRRNEIKVTIDKDTTSGDNDAEYDELAKTMCHLIAVDWDTFNADVLAMCEAAMIRDPDGFDNGSGHLGWAAAKVKQMMEEVYDAYGSKRRLEVEESEARERYNKELANCGNMEAAVQGKWRREAFPERKYERLETSSVICDGLSIKDRSYAMYELQTKLPDSFVGLAYTYDDSGQHSETWMKTVTDEIQAKPKKKKKLIFDKQDSTGDESVSLTSSGKSSENKAQKAAMALAKDDGVVRAQVQTTMTTLLIQVQDRVMTDLGVMHSHEARSANWDDGDQNRDYRGGGAEVEQGTHSGFSLPEVAEQEVWGLDCYTRKNVMALIESEFTPEIAIEFVEKWLLPAINACPVDLAHKMSTACRMLEGLDPAPSAECKTKLSEDSTIPEEASILLSVSQERKQESSVFLRNAMESKIKEHGPPWLKTAAQLIRLASDSMEDDFFRIHPKGHGSVVIGENGLKANSLVTYYRGEVYPAWRWCEKLDAIEQVQKQLDLRPNLPDFYNMAMERPMKDPRGYSLLFVDASRKSGLGSSFSHSCNPTCEVRVVSLNGKLSLSMSTLRDLEQGEELTFDYNAVTESLNEFRFAVCLCGQRKCRGSFLHFATADCYQQVLSRNSPISARFANLVRGCMKQVMSKEDSELLLKHGFNTAAFGAVSFNHHVSNIDPHSTPDSIENVPVWLRTFVADCLRYVEYERRALPVALLCNQMERTEKKKDKEKRKAKAKKTKSAPTKEVVKPSSKAISGSKPMTSYFFFLQNQRDKWEAMYIKQQGDHLKGLERSQAINKVASNVWSTLSEEEKETWKKKSIADWKKNGGKEKARLEKERQRALEKGVPMEIASTPSDDEADKENDSVDTKVNTEMVEAKTISFADADAEGCSAMEQRVQQLAQSLSRVGRVLDRHRESVFEEEEREVAAVDSKLLRNLAPSPLKIMSDGDVANWIWFGVVPQLFSKIQGYFPAKSILMNLLLSTKEAYPVLNAFDENYAVPSLDKKWKHSCTSSDARRLIREALLKFRSNIISYLTHVDKCIADTHNEKRREQARAREEKKKQKLQNNSSTLEDVQSEGDVAMGENVFKSEGDVAMGENVFKSEGDVAMEEDEQPETKSEGVISMGNDDPMQHAALLSALFHSNAHSQVAQSNTETEAMSMRGGGNASSTANGGSDPPNDGVTASTQAADVINVAASLIRNNVVNSSQASSVQSVAPEPSSMIGVEVSNNPSLSSPPHHQQQQQQPSVAEVNSKLSLPPPPPPQHNHHQTSMSADNKSSIPPPPPPKQHQQQLQLPPPMAMDTNANQESDMKVAKPAPTSTIVHATVSEEVQCLLQFSKSPSKFSTPMVPENPVSNQSYQPHQSAIGSAPQAEVEEMKRQVESGTPSPSKLQELITVVHSNSDLGRQETIVTEGVSSTPSLSVSSTQEETKKKKKVVVPLSDVQMKYLNEWLLDPKHILNPYPSDEDKEVIIKDIGIERKRLDGWLMKNRQKILYPEARTVKMEWKKLDQEQWDNFQKNRYMLEATADMLLMYANTNTFFTLEPFRQFDSTPIEVYARELGNEVPRHFAMNYDKSKSSPHPLFVAVDSDGDIHMKDSTETADKSKKSSVNKNPNEGEKEKEDLCSPDDVIDEVAVDYGGEYVLSQLLQWVSGGIGVKKGLPDIYGCVMLPPITGSWDEFQCNEVRASNYTNHNKKKVTEYAAYARPKLAEWIADRYQRGSPWEKDLAKYYCPLDRDAPDPTMPIGSPVLDYLVTGHDDNIRHISAALSGKATTDQGKSKKSTSERLQSTVDEGMPAQAVANWVQCEDPNCLKWRKLPWHVDVDLLPENFFCKDNIWNPKSQRCEDSEDEWDMEDAPIKFDTNAYNFDIGVWFDVQREGKVGYHEAQVCELDFDSNVKRVKFHFWRLSADRDEWIEVGSPRIAPHHAYTPRPKSGYRKDDVSGDNKNVISSARTGQKRKMGDMDGSGDSLQYSSDEQGDSSVTDEPKKFATFPKATIEYLNSWILQHDDNPFPDTSDKATIIADTGLTKRQIGDWMARARKKLRKKNSPSSKKNRSISADLATVNNISGGSPTKVENLLLALKNPNQCNAVPNANPAPVAAASASENPQTSIKELEVYMKTWLSLPHNACNLMPSLAQKEQIVRETGIEKKRLEGWFFRARKKLKKQQEAANQPPQVSQQSSVLSAATASTVEAMTTLSCGTAPSPQGHAQPSGANIPPTTNVPSGANIPLTTNVFSGMSAETVINQIIPSGQTGQTSSHSPNISKIGISEEAKAYLNKWLNENTDDPYPSRREKNEMMSRFEISDEKKLDGWFCRARKRKKKQLEDQRSSAASTGGFTVTTMDSQNQLFASTISGVAQPSGVVNPSSGAAQQPSGATSNSTSGVTNEAQSSASVPPASSSQSTASNSNYTPNFATLASLFTTAGNLHAARSESTSTGAGTGSNASHPQQQQADSGNYRNVRSNEDAILSSFQSLKSMEVQNRALVDQAKAEYTSYQQSLYGQGQLKGQESTSYQGHSSYHQQQGGAATYSYPSPPYQDSSQVQNQGTSTNYSHYQQPPHRYSPPPARYSPPSARFSPHQGSQGQHPPPQYSTYQGPPGQGAPPPPPAGYPYQYRNSSNGQPQQEK